MAVLFTKPIPRPALWGGNAFQTYFDEQIKGKIGQCWLFSAQPNASSIVSNGIYKGQDFRQLFETQPQLFNSRYTVFPFIISLVIPAEDLSVQVHPDSVYAKKLGYASGKNEAWYFMKAPSAGRIVCCQNARNRSEVQHMIANEQWDALLDYLPVAQDDLVYLPAGMLHALGKGSIVFEVQQATDITYRFYDYHRRDEQGKERELQIERALDCLNFHLSPLDTQVCATVVRTSNLNITTYPCGDSFILYRYDLIGEYTLTRERYQLMTVVDGQGNVDGYPVHKGYSFMACANQPVSISGNMRLLAVGETEE